MSKKIHRLWSREEVESALQEAYSIIFHDGIKGDYLSFKLRGIGAFPSKNDWSKAVASAYIDFNPFAEYLQQFPAQCVAALSAGKAKQALEAYRFKGLKTTATSYAKLQAAQDFLASHPDSSKWLALILFSHSRGICVNACREFESDVWSEGSIFIIQLEDVFVSGNGKALSQMLTRDMKKMSKDFPLLIARNMPDALALIIGLDEKADFFNGMGAAVTQ
jgi:hypothetical protein